MGCEKETQYVEIARQRLAAFFNDALPIRPLGKPVYVPTGKERVAQIPDEWKSQSQRVLFEKRSKFK
jgi:adenine-specific DNA-methyltransferase